MRNSTALELLKSAMEHKVDIMVFSAEKAEDFMSQHYQETDYIVVDDITGKIEDVINDETETRTIVYCHTDDTLWNKVFTLMLEHPEKHMIVWKDYNGTHRVDMTVESTKLLKAMLMF